jgi:hypothetical protein
LKYLNYLLNKNFFFAVTNNIILTSSNATEPVGGFKALSVHTLSGVFVVFLCLSTAAVISFLGELVVSKLNVPQLTPGLPLPLSSLSESKIAIGNDEWTHIRHEVHLLMLKWQVLLMCRLVD